jgi:murein DD-endopeptidase MepM/ murein hydrolase activator NlpD
LAALVVAVGLGILGWQRLEGSTPVVDAPASILLGKSPQTVEIVISDPDSGLRVASVRLLDQSGSRNLEEEIWPGSLIGGGAPGSHEYRLSVELDPQKLKIADGAATLVVDARDWAWRDGLEGNRAEISIPLTVDTRPPGLDLISGLTYVYRGGSGVVVYRLNETVVRDGVRVGDAFFPGHPHPAGTSGDRIALFAIPVDAPERPEVRVVAIDEAGNEGSVRLSANVMERVFRHSQLQLSDDFIERVAIPLAERAGLASDDPAQTFRNVNEELRARNEATIRERIAGSSPERRWSGAFEQLPNSQVMSAFADHRTYVYRDQPISQARHYGFDLASTARTPIPAAGAGRVVLAEDLGIYGNCVVIDHGLGIASLYGHLSQIDVAVGDDVTKGQQIGLSGATGLAGGDHLHFAFLVGETYVDPLEWWDQKWVRSHVDVRLERSDP